MAKPPLICETSVSPNNCAHYTVAIAGRTFHLSDAELAPLSDEEMDLFLRMALRYQGVPLEALTKRIVHGSEATNVKTYPLLAPGSSITMTNIGQAWKNVLPGANGQRMLIDFTGCTEYWLVVHANLVGTGPFGFRVVRDSDSVPLYENAAIALSGEQELSTGWQPLPQAIIDNPVPLFVVRFQAKSSVNQDDPIIRDCLLMVR